MSRVRSADTKPEILVRRLAHSLGLRYRLHRSDLAGKPDLVFPSLGKVVFVHGCFWHQHSCKRGNRRPATNRSYWDQKLDRNVLRDQRVQRALRRDGWSVMVVWECQTKDENKLRRRLERFLST